MFGDGGIQVVGHESFKDQRELEVRDREKKFSSVKGKNKNKKKKSLTNSAQTVLVTKDQIGHFLKLWMCLVKPQTSKQVIVIYPKKYNKILCVT